MSSPKRKSPEPSDTETKDIKSIDISGCGVDVDGAYYPAEHYPAEPGAYDKVLFTRVGESCHGDMYDYHICREDGGDLAIVIMSPRGVVIERFYETTAATMTIDGDDVEWRACGTRTGKPSLTFTYEEPPSKRRGDGENDDEHKDTASLYLPSMVWDALCYANAEQSEIVKDIEAAIQGDDDAVSKVSNLLGQDVYNEIKRNVSSFCLKRDEPVAFPPIHTVKEGEDDESLDDYMMSRLVRFLAVFGPQQGDGKAFDRPAYGFRVGHGGDSACFYPWPRAAGVTEADATTCADKFAEQFDKRDGISVIEIE